MGASLCSAAFLRFFSMALLTQSHVWKQKEVTVSLGVGASLLPLDSTWHKILRQKNNRCTHSHRHTRHIVWLPGTIGLDSTSHSVPGILSILSKFRFGLTVGKFAQPSAEENSRPIAVETLLEQRNMLANASGCNKADLHTNSLLMLSTRESAGLHFWWDPKFCIYLDSTMHTRKCWDDSTKSSQFCRSCTCFMTFYDFVLSTSTAWRFPQSLTWQNVEINQQKQKNKQFPLLVVGKVDSCQPRCFVLDQLLISFIRKNL